MCLLVFAWRSHPDYPLVLVGNRDEFYTRRTRPASWWGHAVSLLAGHDEEAGGTWLGITRRGRFAALTNVRAPTERNPHAPSRGALVLSALQAPQRGGDWLQAHAPKT
ncbi:MAG: NRDE family protein, partial [Burkholderiaceae bacterium]